MQPYEEFVIDAWVILWQLRHRATKAHRDWWIDYYLSLENMAWTYLAVLSDGQPRDYDRELAGVDAY